MIGDPGILLAVYLAFAVKHLLCDFIFQTGWMARGKEQAQGWVIPLMAHSGVHAAGTLAVVLVTAPGLWWLAPVDLAIHSTIDRTKALLSAGLSMTDKRFWWALGADQTLHQITHFIYVLLILLS